MIADIIHKVAAMTNEENGDTPYYPRPSSAGPERCIRQMVYHGLNTSKTPLPGRTVVIFSDSSFHEDLTADWIRKTSYTLHSEQMTVECRAPMTKGHIDGIITDLTNIDRLLEHKAINHFSFQKYWDGELPLDYLTQTAIYIEAIQTNDNVDLTEGLLLIKNKNTAQYMEYWVKYWMSIDTLKIISRTNSNGETIEMELEIPEIVTTACNKFNQVADYIERRTLPKRQYDVDHWRCEYCGYNQTCWEGYDKEFAQMKTNEMLPEDVAIMIRYYKELGGQKSDITKEYDDLRTKVKKIMKDMDVRQGIAGEYICKLNLIETAKIDKELLTAKEIEKATKKGFQERLTISQRRTKA